jgi:hypothetical protein
VLKGLFSKQEALVQSISITVIIIIVTRRN